ncbi:MAG: cytochrome c biogenesis protein CcsA [Phycisphaerales bacterium]
MRATAYIHVPHVLHLPGAAEVRAYWAVTVGVAVLAVWMAAFYAPVDGAMGLVQKLVYVHIPAAAGALLGAGAVFGSNIAYIWTRHRVWETAAVEGARVTVFCGLVVLLTGMAWGRSAWGAWWTWSPKLTFTLILCVLYAVMIGLHSLRLPAARRAMLCAVYGAVAFIDAPLVYLSVRLLPDVHPTSVPLTGEMRVTLVTWFVLAALLCGGVLARPVVRHARRQSLREGLGSVHA